MCCMWREWKLDFFQDMLVLGGVRHGFTNPAQAWSNVFDV